MEILDELSNHMEILNTNDDPTDEENDFLVDDEVEPVEDSAQDNELVEENPLNASNSCSNLFANL